MALGDPLGSTVRRREVTEVAPGLDALERVLGHRFRDGTLLGRALTHPSVGAVGAERAYERLEFLGDRVLGLIVADMLYRSFPTAAEGELARRFNALVRRETLANAAREIGLGEHLVLGPGERQSGGREKDAILADACEAVIAALYLDGGIEAARGLVERVWSDRIAGQATAPRDPKTALQEWSQGNGHGLPEYVERSRTGPPHSPRFTVEVHVDRLEPAVGEGGSKREAERNAADAMIRREAIDADG